MIGRCVSLKPELSKLPWQTNIQALFLPLFCGSGNFVLQVTVRLPAVDKRSACHKCMFLAVHSQNLKLNLLGCLNEKEANRFLLCNSVNLALLFVSEFNWI